MAQLFASPRSLFSWDFNIFAKDVFVTFLDTAWLSEGGVFCWNGLDYSLKREKLLSGDFQLLHNCQVIARASKPSFLNGNFQVNMMDRVFDLKPASFWSRTYVLSENGVEHGRVSPKNWFSRKCIIQLPDNLSIPISVFIFWLVLLMWIRDSVEYL